MPPLPEAIILVLASVVPLFSHRVWLHAQLLLLRAMGLGADDRVEAPGVGVGVSHRVVLASRESRASPAQNQCR